jgi:hypothetical protein
MPNCADALRLHVRAFVLSVACSSAARCDACVGCFASVCLCTWPQATWALSLPLTAHLMCLAEKGVFRDNTYEAAGERDEIAEDDTAIEDRFRKTDLNKIPVGLPFTEMVKKAKDFNVTQLHTETAAVRQTVMQPVQARRRAVLLPLLLLACALACSCVRTPACASVGLVVPTLSESTIIAQRLHVSDDNLTAVISRQQWLAAGRETWLRDARRGGRDHGGTMGGG